MPRYEYKVVPAPKKPGKVRGVKGTDNKFASALAALMNEYGADGWEYQRTDTLPCEIRQGLTGRTTTFQNMLIFRREIKDLSETAAPSAPRIEAETMLAVPSFRSPPGTAPALSGATGAAEGRPPAVGAARRDPGRDIAAQ